MNAISPSTSKSSVLRLAEWTLATDPAYTSDLALRQAELLTLDSIACAFAAHDAGAPRRVATMVQDLGGNPQCAAIGREFRTSVLNATLLNCTAVRSLDFNDVQFIQKDGKLHIGGHCSDTLAAALAVGEMQHSSGQDVLTAIIMGYDLFRRLRDLMPMASVWDGAGSSAIVTAAMAGRLMKLDLAQQANALALAFTRCATPSIVRYGELSGAKNMTGAFVAQIGVQCAILASLGMTGPMQVLDHKWGLQTVYDPGKGFDGLWASVDDLFILRSHVKTYACIGTAQAEVTAALEAYPKVKGRTDQIEAIDVIMADLPIIRKQQLEAPRITPSTRETADHSFTFLPAVVLMDGELTPKQFDNARWDEPETKALTAKVRMSVSEELRARSPEAMPCQLKIHLKGGEVIEAECLYPPGHSYPDRGLPKEPVVEKFIDVTADRLSRERQDQIVSAFLSLRKQEDIAAVMTLLTA